MLKAIFQEFCSKGNSFEEKYAKFAISSGNLVKKSQIHAIKGNNFAEFTVFFMFSAFKITIFKKVTILWKKIMS